MTDMQLFILITEFLNLEHLVNNKDQKMKYCKMRWTLTQLLASTTTPCRSTTSTSPTLIVLLSTMICYLSICSTTRAWSTTISCSPSPQRTSSMSWLASLTVQAWIFRISLFIMRMRWRYILFIDRAKLFKYQSTKNGAQSRLALSLQTKVPFTWNSLSLEKLKHLITNSTK